MELRRFLARNAAAKHDSPLRAPSVDSVHSRSIARTPAFGRCSPADIFPPNVAYNRCLVPVLPLSLPPQLSPPQTSAFSQLPPTPPSPSPPLCCASRFPWHPPFLFPARRSLRRRGVLFQSLSGSPFSGRLPLHAISL